MVTILESQEETAQSSRDDQSGKATSVPHGGTATNDHKEKPIAIVGTFFRQLNSVLSNLLSTFFLWITTSRFATHVNSTRNY